MPVMNITTMIEGTTARIVPHTAIDQDTLPLLRATAAALPQWVTEVVWDLHDTPFMDLAGLHLLTDPEPAGRPPRRTAVTGMRPQPQELLRVAAELFPPLRFPRQLPGARPHQAA
ncbi:hypothetical protein ACFY8O_27675 [Streptomyces argenteolus]|uniref:STAS domain-containing protein n=1 Tax=Streptomyces argenteolus TaxID=67274 RepID=A0ABW6XD49_9ACTN